MIDLGYSNGWNDTPEVVKECEKKNHPVFEKNVGNCLTEYSCKECKYKFLVDSSD